ncbi:hypothetical protein [Planobispora longispora]|uniref:Uncharacterized protein n=1 Tax=Planobispora longispora TaxID=28887 RepID=A0A8J3RTQ1_9ACTN|nr:hypothetical protein [Planobispora longispora]GIH78073.1 hypothetical protein Plo01_45020 [Planobispora longispora]
MIADRYGYAVLPGQALATPGVEAVLRRRERAGVVWALAGLVPQGVLVAVLLPAGGPAGAIGWMLAVTFSVTAGLAVLWRRARRRERRILQTYGWQVWPCRDQPVKVVSGDGERSRGRRWSTENRVVLLQPDGQSHCAFPPPWDGWDGPGPRGPVAGDEMWFAGDTRFGGVLAVPGGMPFRYVTRGRPGTRKGTALEDELARRSGLMRG